MTCLLWYVCDKILKDDIYIMHNNNTDNNIYMISRGQDGSIHRASAVAARCQAVEWVGRNSEHCFRPAQKGNSTCVFCVCVRVCVRMYVRVYIDLHVCPSVYLPVCVWHVCVWCFVYVCVYVYACVCLCARGHGLPQRIFTWAPTQIFTDVHVVVCVWIFWWKSMWNFFHTQTNIHTQAITYFCGRPYMRLESRHTKIVC